MTLEEHMWRQAQRDNGNPYKEGSDQWLAWGRGYSAGEVSEAIKKMDIGQKYYELLWAVGLKHPGESRHETALRYIRQAENNHSLCAPSAAVEEERK